MSDRLQQGGPMRVAAPAETQAGERRVAVVPEILPKLADADVVLCVQPLPRASIALSEHDSLVQTVRMP